MAKKIIIASVSIFLSLLLVVGGYVMYVIIAYYRIEDNLALEVTNNNNSIIEVNTDQLIMSFNTGFGAYSVDYSFFMDGGKYSRAFSKDEVLKNVNGMISTIESVNPNLLLLQEVDIDATRSYHVDQAKMFTDKLNKVSTFALNYDSPYLFYPIFEPHGKSKAGLLTISNYRIENATRHSLPIETGFRKFLDLDRCYTKNILKTSNNKNLVLYNVHLSAYTKDGTIATDQLVVLFEDMKKEFSNGNYIVCGGDFNKDLLQNSGEIFGVSGEDYSWAKPFPTEIIPDGFSLVSGYDESNPIASCRDTEKPYVKGEIFTITLDGFIVSSNVEYSNYKVIDAGFTNSDHNPVTMNFKLIG